MIVVVKKCNGRLPEIVGYIWHHQRQRFSLPFCQLRMAGYLEAFYTFRFSDFDLEPPSKFLGALRVKETISVGFNLKLQMV
jgi:hypothetical protein